MESKKIVFNFFFNFEKKSFCEKNVSNWKIIFWAFQTWKMIYLKIPEAEKKSTSFFSPESTQSASSSSAAYPSK